MQALAKPYPLLKKGNIVRPICCPKLAVLKAAAFTYYAAALANLVNGVDGFVLDSELVGKNGLLYFLYAVPCRMKLSFIGRHFFILVVTFDLLFYRIKNEHGCT